MTNIWLISDTHFRHSNIYKFLATDGTRVRKEFGDVAEGDAYMIAHWNALVKPQDHVWHLGDFCMGNPIWWLDVGPRLSGHKRIIPGNHDQVPIDIYKKAGFQKLQGAKEIQIDGLRLLCSHYPLHPSSLFNRDWNIHGHTHEKPSPPSFVDDKGKHKGWFNVSVERIGYKPIHIEDLVKQLKETTLKTGDQTGATEKEA